MGTILLSAVLSFSCFTAVVTAREYNEAEKEQVKIEENESYIYTEMNIYVAKNVALDDQIERIRGVYEKLPAGLKDYLLNEWIVVIETDDGGRVGWIGENLKTGEAQLRNRIIYLHPTFSACDFAHECGHVVDYSFGSLSKTDEFREFYETQQELFLDEGLEATSYSISNPTEFFAALFASYIEDEDHFKDVFPAEFFYFEKIRREEEEWRYSFLGWWLANAKRVFVMYEEQI